MLPSLQCLNHRNVDARYEDLSPLERQGADTILADRELFDSMMDVRDRADLASTFALQLNDGRLMRLQYDPVDHAIGINLKKDITYHGIDLGLQSTWYADELNHSQLMLPDTHPIQSDAEYIVESYFEPDTTIKLIRTFADGTMETLPWSWGNNYVYLNKTPGLHFLTTDEAIKYDEFLEHGGEEEGRVLDDSLASKLFRTSIIPGESVYRKEALLELDDPLSITGMPHTGDKFEIDPEKPWVEMVLWYDYKFEGSFPGADGEPGAAFSMSNVRLGYLKIPIVARDPSVASGDEGGGKRSRS